MNIAYLGYLPPLQIGGGGLCNHEILKGMVARGWTVSAITPLPAGASAEAYEAAMPGAEILTFPTDGFDADALAPRSDNYRDQRHHVIALLHRLVARRRLDAIFVGRSSFALDVAALAQRHHIRTLIIHHGSIHWMLAGHYPPSLTWEYLSTFRAFDCGVVPAKHSERRLRAAGFDRIRTIPNGIDVDRFRPGPGDAALRDKWAIRPDHIVVAHVSNMKKVKRVADLAEAAKTAVERDPRLLFLIVGDGPALAETRLISERYGLNEHFRFAGLVPYEQISDFIGLSDMVVMPSETESMCRVHLETMASGKVLVASDIDGAREVVRDGIEGLLFPLGDIAKLADTIVAAAADPAHCRRLGDAARVRAVASHRLEDMVNRYLATFEELVAVQPVNLRRAGQAG